MLSPCTLSGHDAINIGSSIVLDPGQTLICRLTYYTTPPTVNEKHDFYFEWVDQKLGEVDVPGSGSGHVDHQSITTLIQSPPAGWQRRMTLGRISQPVTGYQAAYFSMRRTGFNFVFPELDSYSNSSQTILEWTTTTKVWMVWNAARTTSFIVGALNNLLPGSYCEYYGLVGDKILVRNLLPKCLNPGTMPLNWAMGYAYNKLCRVLSYVPGGETATVAICDPIYNAFNAKVAYASIKPQIAGYFATAIGGKGGDWEEYWLSQWPSLLATRLTVGGDHFLLDEIFDRPYDYPPWAALTTYKMDDVVHPCTYPDGHAILAKCTTAGKTGIREPYFYDKSNGVTVADGTVVWTIFRAIPQAGSLDPYFMQGATMLVRKQSPGMVFGNLSYGANGTTGMLMCGIGWALPNNCAAAGAFAACYARSWIASNAGAITGILSSVPIMFAAENQTFAYIPYQKSGGAGRDWNISNNPALFPATLEDKPMCWLVGTVTEDNLEYPDWEIRADTLMTATVKFFNDHPIVYDKKNRRLLALVNRNCDPRADLTPNFTFANGAERRAYTPVAGDVNKTARDTDTGFMWTLARVSPAYWRFDIQGVYADNAKADSIYESLDYGKTWTLLYDATASLGTMGMEAIEGIFHLEVSDKGWHALVRAHRAIPVWYDDPVYITPPNNVNFQTGLYSVINGTVALIFKTADYGADKLGWAGGYVSNEYCFTYSKNHDRFYVSFISTEAYVQCLCQDTFFPAGESCAQVLDVCRGWVNPPSVNWCYNAGPSLCSCYCQEWFPGLILCGGFCNFLMNFSAGWGPMPIGGTSVYQNKYSADNWGTSGAISNPFYDGLMAGACDPPKDWGMFETDTFFMWTRVIINDTVNYVYMSRLIGSYSNLGLFGKTPRMSSGLTNIFNVFDSGNIVYNFRYLAPSDNIGNCTSINPSWDSSRSYNPQLPSNIDLNTWIRFV